MWCLKKTEGRQGRRSGYRERRGEGAEDGTGTAPLRAHAGKIGAIQWGPRPDGFPSRRRPSINS